MKLGIVVPCFNEQEIIQDTNNKLNNYLEKLIYENKISSDSCIIYVNDGSKDSTWKLVEQICKSFKNVIGINLSSNVGHQNALMAGLIYTIDKFDATVSIDADLQDDINIIEEMVYKFKEGNEIVYGVRSSRKSDTFFKRNSAQVFYKIMSALGVDIVYNHADFRLMSNVSIKALSKYKERNLFLRGIVPTLGYKSDTVYYERKERLAGESKYPLKKMIKFAFDGVTSFSIKPITSIMILGISIILISLLSYIYI